MQKQGNNSIANPQNFVVITSKRNGTIFQSNKPMVMHELCMLEIPFIGVFCLPKLVYVCTLVKKELIEKCVHALTQIQPFVGD